jgi:hypothetical protein
MKEQSGTRVPLFRVPGTTPIRQPASSASSLPHRRMFDRGRAAGFPVEALPPDVRPRPRRRISGRSVAAGFPAEAAPYDPAV